MASFSCAYGDPAPLAERPDLDNILASDLELAGLVRTENSQHLLHERERLWQALRTGSTAFLSERALLLFRPLTWDTQHFGVGVADLTRFYGDNPPLSHVLEHAARARVTWLSARCRADRPDQVHALEENGFRWMDTSVELGKPLGGAPAAPNTQVRAACEQDVKALRAIVGQFRQNRFHFDPRIAPEKARSLYESWVENGALGRGDQVFVAESAGAVQGFCGYRAAASVDPLEVATLTLIVIAETARGQGLFDALVNAVECHAYHDGARYLVTSTQVHNTQSLRAFSRAGFRPFSARHIFHRWAH